MSCAGLLPSAFVSGMFCCHLSLFVACFEMFSVLQAVCGGVISEMEKVRKEAAVD
jgi:hypothetical protein